MYAELHLRLLEREKQLLMGSIPPAADWKRRTGGLPEVSGTNQYGAVHTPERVQKLRKQTGTEEKIQATDRIPHKL
ncbi:MAG: hypothetical protein ACI4UV_19600 [Victivallales bacterium]